MKKLMRLVWPARLGTMVVGLVAISLMFAMGLYALMTVEPLQDKGPPKRIKPQQAVLDLVYRPLANLPAGDPRLDRAIEAANVLAHDLNLRKVTEFELPPRSDWEPAGAEFANILNKRGVVGYTVPATDPEAFQPTVLIELPSGTILASAIYPPIPPPKKSVLFSTSIVGGEELILLLIILPIGLLLIAGRISRQLRRFAKAAEEFSSERRHEPLEVSGPAEIRTAARAFNRMRDRIAEYSAGQTKLLASIGHDLRAPVTRLRLRIEFVLDPELRAGMVRDLARLESMIDSALSFLRDGHSTNVQETFSVRSLLQTVSDSYTEVGKNLLFEAPRDSQILGDPEAIERAIENLIGNAFKHADTVRLSLDLSDDDTVSILVDDDGPGIPPEKREMYMRPFASGTEPDENGRISFGLGLPITDAIAKAHQGRLELLESVMGGLRARLTFPKAARL
ncbi:HAMP domain-containing sensor histidine kinase [Pseudoruegeria sp. HB172150]|uniref:sensor histidine kinase n=1 Tax=Pseudoruegeria sp. HB172150 TaxID=2721164 RepID=UPI0015573524|nr:HAMP domain-containing sensor histidine kinase [Pseudoruegeria sp. HB172150]